ncbi:MAG: penicillin-binding protein 2 [Verrucomicrobia bacterium]|nr:penicillin-binding protein 2 [Verrucomicrobiota bacterium]
MRWLARRRAAVACVLVALVFTGFSARLIHLQVGKHEEYSAIAASKHSFRQIVPARRGLITDRNGEILAANMPARRVIADGSHIKDKAPQVAEVASPYLGIPVDELTKLLTTTSKFKVIMPELDEEKALALQKELDKKGLRGLYFTQNSIRTYPNGPILSHVLGFMSRKNPNDEVLVGVDGIERSMEEQLHGEDGFRHIEHDRAGREIVVYRGQEKAPRHGSNVELTIDMALQSILEAELENAYRELKPDTAVGIIADPKTGEILAMSNRPTFDPNNLNGTKPDEMKNRAIIDMVEPGSTFKIVVSSGALSEHTITEKTQIFCENGRFLYGGRILKDHHGYGSMTVEQILIKSSNIGSAKMALMMGDDKYYEYVRRFGFGERTGVALPGEIPGLVHPPARWDKLTITRMAMGHSVAVTPLQIVMGMSVIANGGKLMKPQIVHAIKDEDGQEIYRSQPEVVREVIPEATAKFVSKALTGVCDDGGTATLARVNGYNVAGKTGTAEKVNPKGGYMDGKYVVSFVGFMPAEDPRFVCLIMIDNAKLSSGLNYGGLVAAPVFSRVAEKTARYLDLVPNAPSMLPIALSEPSSRKVTP